MPNLSALAPLTTLATSLSNLILVSPQAIQGYQPQNPNNTAGNQSTVQQSPSILFNYEGEQTVSIQSDITDHYAENNISIQDNISLKPVIITTQGFIGELNNVVPAELNLLKTAADKLTTIGSYTPELTETALIAYNEAFLAYQIGNNAVNSAIAAWSSITGTGGESVIQGNSINRQPNQTQQQLYFQQFYGYWVNRYLFTVQTPWAIFQNMAIQNLKAIQDAETRVITDFEVTFKMIRTASTGTGNALIQSIGRWNLMGAALQTLGSGNLGQGPSLSSGLTKMEGG